MLPDTKPKKPPVFPYTPAIALALVEAATKHEDTLKALNSLRKANKVTEILELLNSHMHPVLSF